MSHRMRRESCCLRADVCGVEVDREDNGGSVGHVGEFGLEHSGNY